MIALLLALVSAGPVVTMNELVDVALKTHPRLESSRSRIDKSRAELEGARSPYFPSVSASSSLTRNDVDAGSTTTSVSDVTLLQASVSQRLWDFGRTAAQVRSGASTVSAGELDFEKARRDITFDVQRSYVSAVLSEQLAELRSRTLDAREQMRDKIDVLVKAGVRPRSDLIRSDLELQSARIDQTSAEVGVASARITLQEAAAMRELPEARFENVLATIPEIPPIIQLAESAALVRPEYLALLERRDAASATLFAKNRDKYPVLSAQASTVMRDRTIDKVAQPDHGEWSARVVLGWDDFNWVAKNAATGSAEADLKEVNSEIQNLERSIRNEVLAEGKTLLEAQGRIHGAQNLVSSATENLRLIRARYDAGAATILDVTDAQVRLTESEFSELQARADAWIARYRFDRAAGW